MGFLTTLYLDLGSNSKFKYARSQCACRLSVNNQQCQSTWLRRLIVLHIKVSSALFTSTYDLNSRMFSCEYVQVQLKHQMAYHIKPCQTKSPLRFGKTKFFLKKICSDIYVLARVIKTRHVNTTATPCELLDTSLDPI